MKKSKLSIVLATFNEEDNIAPCLESIKDIADEIVIVDGSSSDKTVPIALSYGARVIKRENYPNFHINKKYAIDHAHGEWVLQLDADERVSIKLAQEIAQVMRMTPGELEVHQQNLRGRELLLRHQHLIEERDGKIGDTQGEYTAFFFPRRNFFLGKYMKYGGTYPDGVIRLFRNGKANLPAKDVHEQMWVKGRVGWLRNDLLHLDSPTFARYIARNSRYIDLIAKELKKEKTGKSPITFLNYFLVKPLHWFLLTQIRHKGILDGFQGIVFSFFSALRFPRAYIRYLKI